MNNRDRLIDLMVTHKLERREIAELLHVSPDTVGHWLLPVEAANREDVPDMAIDLLTMKLAAREPSASEDDGEDKTVRL
jgi:orotate phosphoribosyltransferase-like protein